MGPSENGDGSRGRDAARTAAVAAASSAAVLVARRALGRRGGRKQELGDTVSAGLEAAWSAAREVLLPALEEVATAAGRYVGEHAPDAIRDSLLPRFVDAFHETHERREGDDAHVGRD